MRLRSGNREHVIYSNTNGSPIANSTLTMMTLPKPVFTGRSTSIS